MNRNCQSHGWTEEGETRKTNPQRGSVPSVVKVVVGQVRLGGTVTIIIKTDNYNYNKTFTAVILLLLSYSCSTSEVEHMRHKSILMLGVRPPSLPQKESSERENDVREIRPEDECSKEKYEPVVL